MNDLIADSVRSINRVDGMYGRARITPLGAAPATGHYDQQAAISGSGAQAMLMPLTERDHAAEEPEAAEIAPSE